MLIWGALGCYGLYTFWNRYLGAAVVFGTSAGPPTTLQQPQPESISLAPSNRQEIVIRVVKEVVHVDADGRPLGRGPWRREHAPSDNDDDTDTADAQEYQQIAHCVANVYSSSS